VTYGRPTGHGFRLDDRAWRAGGVYDSCSARLAIVHAT
jgi:hypothetical protein